MTENTIPKVHVIEGALTKEQAEFYRNLFWETSVENVGNPRPHFMFQGISWFPFEPREPMGDSWLPDITISSLVFWAEKFFLHNYKIEEKFELKRLFVHTMKTGAEIEAHVDDGDIYEGKPEFEKHYSGILILNDDYEGGELYFRELGLSIKPPAGTLVLFRGDAERIHGVTQVTSGYRMSMPIFFREYK